MSALILALVASICLAVLPQNLTNEYGNNAVGTAADGEQIVWKTIYINGTHAENIAKINALTADDKYVKIVLQTDWQCQESLSVGANDKVFARLIWDMNGHTFTYIKSASSQIHANILEFTDSSAAGNGLFKSYSSGSSLCVPLHCENLILSGGTLQGFVDLQHTLNLIMTGGNLINYGTTSTVATLLLNSDSSQNAKLYFAPYVTATPITPNTSWSNPMLYNPETSFEWRTQTNPSHAAYAISKSDQWCGAYNYAYGAGWDLAAGDCILEHLTENRPYYLWYRNSDHEWYQLLSAL